MTLLQLENVLAEKNLDIKEAQINLEKSKTCETIEYYANLITIYNFDKIAIEIEIRKFNDWLVRNT